LLGIDEEFLKFQNIGYNKSRRKIMTLKNAIKTILFISLLVAFSCNPAQAFSEKWIDATHILNREIELPPRNRARAASGISFADVNPEMMARNKKIGQTETFWVRNIATGKFIQIKASLKTIGEHCYVYLANDVEVKAATIEKIKNKFDTVIYPTNTAHFGREANPGIDNDSRIYLLMSDIKDGYKDKNDGFVAGYFFAGDQMFQDEFEQHSKVRSNQKDILYLDTWPSDPEADDYLEIVAHEFQHMIHHNHDNEEVTWVNEGCSQIAPVLCGYAPPGHYRLLKDEADRSLNFWAKWNPMPDYGQVYLWNQFLLEALLRNKINPADFFKSLVASKKTSIGGYVEALKKFNLSFSDLFTDFSITTHLNNPSIFNGQFAFENQSLRDFKINPVKVIKNYPTHEKDSVKVWGSELFIADLSQVRQNLEVSFSGYRRAMGGTRPYFRVALILSDSSGALEPRIGFMKLRVNPTDKNRLIGFNSIKANGAYDQLYCVIMALAPEEIDDSKYMPASGFIYDLKIEPQNTAIADNSLSLEYLVTRLNHAEKMTDRENALLIKEHYAHQLLMNVRQELENGSFKTIDELLRTEDNHHNLLSPYARDISGMLRFYQIQANENLDPEQLKLRIEQLDNF
jgi:hypothetical protein